MLPGGSRMIPAAARLAGALGETSREEGAADMVVASERCIPRSAPSVALIPWFPSCPVATDQCIAATASAP